MEKPLDARSNTALSLLGKLSSRLAVGDNPEKEQALIRIIIGAVALGYVLSPLYSTRFGAQHTIAQSIGIAFFLYAVLLYLAISAMPNRSLVRRVVSIVADLGTLSFLLLIGGEGSVALIAIYLWVIIGNGFRYGVEYLYVAAAVAIAGFLVVMAFSEFWLQHHYFSASVLVLLVAIPLYVAKLLHKMRAAMEHAQQANQAKTRFLANMSHELRTPMNGIIGLSDMLLEVRMAPAHKELVSTIKTTARTLLDLVGDVLDMSKLEANKVEILEGEMRPHQMLAEVISMLRYMALKKGVALYGYVDPELPHTLLADGVHLKQVLLNLAGNAVKFTDEGSVWIRVRLGRPQDDGNGGRPLLELDIEDTGIGIAKDRQEAIFDPFEQAEAATSQHYGGTGLGTSIARRLVQLMGGQIELHSEPGVGTRFRVSVPCRVIEAEPKPDLSSRRLLMLASELTVRSIERKLEGMGTEVIRAEDRREFLQLIREEKALALCLVEDTEADEVAEDMARDVNWSLHSVPIALIGTQFRRGKLPHPGHTPWYSQIGAHWDSGALWNILNGATLGREQRQRRETLAAYYRSTGGTIGLKILVADDNETNRKVLAGLLNKAGHEVVEVADGEDALDLLLEQERGIQIAVVDLNMPNLGGDELIRAYRVLQVPERQIPIGVLTADGTPEARQDCEQVGASFFLVKPVETEQLLDTIAEATGASVSGAVKPPPRAAAVGESSYLCETRIQQLLEEGGGVEFLRSLADSFEQDTEQRMRELQHALAATNTNDLRGMAHSIRGTASMLGAHRLKDTCSLLTEAAKSGRENELRYLVRRAKQEFDTTLNVMRQMIESRSSAGLCNNST